MKPFFLTSRLMALTLLAAPSTAEAGTRVWKSKDAQTLEWRRAVLEKLTSIDDQMGAVTKSRGTVPQRGQKAKRSNTPPKK